MVNAELKDEIIWIIINEDLTYESFLKAVNPIFESKSKYTGFISDGRKLKAGKFKPLDMKKINNHHQQYNKDKPNAILMNNDGLTMIAKIFIKFTGAKNTKIFSDEESAINWVKGFK